MFTILLYSAGGRSAGAEWEFPFHKRKTPCCARSRAVCYNRAAHASPAYSFGARVLCALDHAWRAYEFLWVKGTHTCGAHSSECSFFCSAFWRFCQRLQRQPPSPAARSMSSFSPSTTFMATFSHLVARRVVWVQLMPVARNIWRRTSSSSRRPTRTPQLYRLAT